MRVIKAFTVLAVLATVLWCGYWVAATYALRRAIDAGLARVSEVHAQSFSILGFPNRFDVTFDEPRVESADLGWSAPFVQIFALTYRPQHLIAVFAPDQTLRIGTTEVTLHTDDLRASVVMEASRQLPLDRATLVGTQIDAQSGGATFRANEVRLASRRIADTVHEVVFQADTVLPDPEFLRQVDPQGFWPRRFTVIRLDGEVEFQTPLDLSLMADPQPRIARLTLTGIRLGWEDSDVSLAGRLTPDSDGRLSGDVTLTVTGWSALLARARDTGLLADEDRGLLAPVIDALSAQAHDDRLEVPLAVVDGDVRIGPLLLGSLPLIR